MRIEQGFDYRAVSSTKLDWEKPTGVGIQIATIWLVDYSSAFIKNRAYVSKKISNLIFRWAQARQYGSPLISGV